MLTRSRTSSPRRTRARDLMTPAVFAALADELTRAGLLRKGVALRKCQVCAEPMLASLRTRFCSESCRVRSHREAAPREDTARKPTGARQRPIAAPTPLPATTPARKPAARPDDECPADCPDRGLYTPAGSDGSYLTVFCARHDPAPPSFEPAPD